jgi:glycosyltransferase involved in cell wall biosynthesis
MTITIGVIIPAYNRPLEVAAALKSVLGQTRSADQIVVVDDGSQPPLRMSEIGGTDNLQIVRLAKNVGPAAARQAGIDVLTTSYVAFLDSDDEWLPDKLERQTGFIDSLDSHHNVAVGCGWTWFTGDHEPVSVLPRGSDSLSDFASGCWFSPGSTVLMLRNDLMRIRGFDTSLRRLEDLDLFIRFAAEGGRLAVAPFVGALIRRGNNAKLCDVRAAANRIRTKHIESNSPIVRTGLVGHLESWLSLEQAAAARNEHRWAKTTEYLVRSFSRRPRTRLHLKDWWTSVPTPIIDRLTSIKI